jgi:hypothetical protein
VERVYPSQCIRLAIFADVSVTVVHIIGFPKLFELISLLLCKSCYRVCISRIMNGFIGGFD